MSKYQAMDSRQTDWQYIINAWMEKDSLQDKINHRITGWFFAYIPCTVIRLAIVPGGTLHRQVIQPRSFFLTSG
jgi:hypothetical protein